MNNQTGYKKVMEIDLKELCWKLLSQWKAVILFSFAMALLFCGIKYMSDRAAYEAAIAAQKEAEKQKMYSQDERIANVISTLSGSDKEKINYIAQEKKWIAKQNSYLKNSILMQTDPTNQRELDIVYSISADNADDLPMLVQSYSSFVDDEEMVEEIKPFIDPDADSKYIGELFCNSEKKDSNETVSGAGAAVTISIILPEDADAETVAKAVTDAIVKQGKSMMPGYPHSIKMANYDVARIYNSKVIEEREKSFTNINNMEASIKNAESSLSAEQKAALEAISAIIDEEETLNSMDSQANTITDNTAEVKLVPPGISKKFAFLGFIFGVLLYALCYVAFIIIKGCINSSSSIESYTKMRLLGEAYFKGERKGLSQLLHSDFVDKIHYKGLPDFNTQLKKIEESVEAVCAHANANDMTMIKLTDSDAIMPVKEAIASISNSMSKNDIFNNELDAMGEFDEKLLLSINNAAFVIGDDTKVSRLDRVISLCRDYDINLFGSIYFSEM